MQRFHFGGWERRPLCNRLRGSDVAAGTPEFSVLTLAEGRGAGRHVGFRGETLALRILDNWHPAAERPTTCLWVERPGVFDIVFATAQTAMHAGNAVDNSE